MSFTDNTLIAQAFANQHRRSLGTITKESEDASGRTSAEIERVLYARVKDFKFLDHATGADRQEQWSIKIEKTEENAGSGSIRVRKSINLRSPGAAVQYVLTSKLDIDSKGSSAETPEPSSEDQFNIFKYFANRGMLKDRYYFPIEGTGTDVKWEIDCFPKPGAMYHEWIKIDLEKWPRGKQLPPLPFEFLELIDGSEGMEGDSADKIAKLYEDIFLTKNTQTPLVDYGTPAPTPGGNTDEEGQEKQNDQGNQTGNAGTDDGAGGNAGAAGDGGDDQTGGVPPVDGKPKDGKQPGDGDASGQEPGDTGNGDDDQ